MFQIGRVNTDLKSNQRKFETFLEKHGLKAEVLDSLYVCYDNQGEWLACAGRREDVFKNFAIEDEYRGMGIFESLISSLISEAFKLGYKRNFVYTKAEYDSLFTSFGFELLAKTKKTAFLMKSDRGIEGVIDEMGLSDFSGTRGAIVMNANPFTKGHLYLVEKAREEVDQVIVFLVEGEKTIPFDLRFKMARASLEKLDKVVLVKGGDLIISRGTFPSYFLKAKELIDREHAYIDALVFKNHLAKKLKIVKRFVGDEPLDESTNIYNQVLREVLEPEVEVKIIKRLEANGEVVSASRVRKYIQAREYEKMKDLVPEGTYRELIGYEFARPEGK